MPDRAGWLARRAACAGLCVWAALAWSAPARAEPMRVMRSFPQASASMDGAATEFFVEFDRPVDHAASRLVVTQDGKTVQVLHPRLRSRPNTLYSGVRRLPPGAYSLRWTTQAANGQDASDGEIAFTVR